MLRMLHEIDIRESRPHLARPRPWRCIAMRISHSLSLSLSLSLSCTESNGVQILFGFRYDTLHKHWWTTNVFYFLFSLSFENSLHKYNALLHSLGRFVSVRLCVCVCFQQLLCFECLTYFTCLTIHPFTFMYWLFGCGCALGIWYTCTFFFSLFPAHRHTLSYKGLHKKHICLHWKSLFALFMFRCCHSFFSFLLFFLFCLSFSPPKIFMHEVLLNKKTLAIHCLNLTCVMMEILRNEDRTKKKDRERWKNKYACTFTTQKEWNETEFVANYN